MKPLLISPLLLVASNVFMTFAWYGHLKSLNQKPCFVAALAIWLITLSVFIPFAILYMKQQVKWIISALAFA